jgi:hypothetical protein
MFIDRDDPRTKRFLQDLALSRFYDGWQDHLDEQGNRCPPYDHFKDEYDRGYFKETTDAFLDKLWNDK